MEMTKKIPQRSELPEQDTWRLEDLYATEEAWEEALTQLQAGKDVLAAYAGRLGDSGETLCAYLTENEKIVASMELLANYIHRKADEDTRISKYQAMSGRFMSVVVAISTATSFDTPEMMAISDETLDRFYRDFPGLERYRRYLTDLRRRKAHTLSAVEERIMAATGDMGKAASQTYNALMNADIKFPDAVDSKGEKHPLSLGTFVPLQESGDRELRKNAFETLYATIEGLKNTHAALLDAQNKKLKFHAESRNYPSALEASLSANNVPVSVYDNLIAAVHANIDKMHRYVRLRKKLMGVDELHYYDICTPLLQDVDKHIPYAQAKQMVYDALAPMGDDYRRILQEGFDNRWIDVYQNVGKCTGAYSAGAAVHPYVLMNYTGNLDSVFTLVHEMGHALHSYYSNAHQNPVDADYVIFVAEVASTCNEALLMEHLLSQTTDKRERAYLINYFLEQFRTTLYRQTMFAEFEKTIGQWVGEGKTLTAQTLCEEYHRLVKFYYGEALIADDPIAMEWARIPHFYYNYYVFQYATGYSAAIALSRRILREGETAVKDYLGFLSGGCAKSPIDLLKGAGVDMTDPAPVNEALQLFDRLLDEMEQLLEV